MDSHLANLLRRSRQPHQRAAAANLKSSLEKKSLEHALDRRLTPEQLSAIQAANSRAAATTPAAAATTASAARTTNPATPATAATEAVGGVASRIQSSSAVTSSAVVRSSTVNDISPAMPASSAVTSSSAVPSSSTRVVTSSSTVRSTSSVAPSSSSTRPATLTVTSTRALSSASSSLSASSTLPTVSAAAASQSSESTGLGTGPIVGIALAVVVGVVVVGSCIGWCYRKHAQRKYSDKAPWAKLDDNVTPYPQDNEKSYHPDDDIYGQSQAPVIGSRRALALARQNGFNADGSMRPDSDYMMQRGDNNAGFGAGRGLGHQYGGYPTMDQSQGYNQNQDYDQNQDYHYGHEQGPPSPAYDYGSAQTGMAISAPGNTRQLVGSNGAPHGYPMPAPLAPVALGRPLPPQSAAEFADREEFMELPKPTPTNSSGNHMSQYSTYGLAYADSEPEYMPHTATTTGWAADSKTQHTPLPVIEPASPLMSSFDFQKRQSLGPIASNFATKYGAGSNTLPNYHDEDEHSRQKRMYGEVAFAAGVMEPTTPHTADLSSSTNSYESASSFSTHQQSEPRSISHRLPPAPMPALPTVNVLPPQPYQHGRPLSPLTEVETPRSMALTSSSVLHGQELNPFEHALHPPTHQSGFRPPYSASSSTGATAFPSPSFPPPSPGGMSVPGSVTDSPRKRESMFDVDDAYGGI